jgi:hypothetical protein
MTRGSSASYGARVSGFHLGFDGSRFGDAWGHWGAYYGPMIHGP